MENDAFSIIKGRYLILIWLLPLIYMPGIEAITSNLLDAKSEWYWYDIIYYYYYHVIVLISVLILIFIGKPKVQFMFGAFKKREIVPAFYLTAFVFAFSIATAFILFYPLSFIIPEFVRYWLIDLPPYIYTENDAYPIAPNLLSFISLVLIGPILEEFVFRGLLLHRWQKKWGLNIAILLSSFLFGIVHPDPVGAVAFGIAMCVLYLRTQSLWLPIICHSVNNFVVWLIEAGMFSFYGPEYYYTIEDFQNDWFFGILMTVISILWIHVYLRKAKSSRKWALPNV